MTFVKCFARHFGNFFAFIGVIVLVGCSSTQPVSTGISKSTSKSVLGEQYRTDYVKAITDCEKGNFLQASATLNRIMEHAPGFAEGWANLGLAQLRAGNIAQAKQAATNALQLEPQSAPLHNLLGLIAVEIGTYKEAEQHYSQALQINPKLANAHYNLGLLNDIYYQNISKAIQHYERYLSLITTADPDTENWVAELKRNVK